MEKYKCDICGVEHAVFRGLENPMPELMNELSEKEKQRRINIINTDYIVDGKLLLTKGKIFIYLEGVEEPFFVWDVWVSVDYLYFKKKQNALNKGEMIEFDAKLESEIPFYEVSRGLKVKALMNLRYDFAVIKVEGKSSLKKDQAKNISKKRVSELMNFINHDTFNEERNIFTHSFSKRLKKVLEKVDTKYIQKHKDFIININIGDVTLFQVMNSRMLQSRANKKESKDGFGLSISFDLFTKDSIEASEIFKQKKYAQEFEYYNFDGMLLYQIDLGNDIKRLRTLIPKILKNVYQKDIESVDIDSFKI